MAVDARAFWVRAPGIGEIRSCYANVEYRPLGCLGPGANQFTILLGAYKKGRVWTPREAQAIALVRSERLLENPGRGNRYEIEL